jgi:hypothetical protein
VTDTLMHRQYLASALIARGRLREAFEVDRDLIEHPELSPFSAFLDPFLDLSLLGVVPDSLARSMFARGLAPGTSRGLDPSFGQRRAMQGLPWWFARRDSVSLARFAARARSVERVAATPAESLQALYRSAAASAYLSLVRGDSAEAERMFRAIPDSLCVINTCSFEKLTLARLRAARGDFREAKLLLDRWMRPGEGHEVSSILGALERGRLAERLGERDAAVTDYQYVAAIWQRADPELQPYVSEAREGIQRLVGER